jgi:hypothetical protein
MGIRTVLVAALPGPYVVSNFFSSARTSSIGFAASWARSARDAGEGCGFEKKMVKK